MNLMIGNMKLRYLCFWCVVYVLSSCHTQEEYLKDTTLWVGGNRIMDRTLPFPYLLEVSEDKCMLRDHAGELIDQCKITKNISKGDTLTMKNHQFEVLFNDQSRINIFQLNDTLNYPIIKGRIDKKYRAKLIPTFKTKRIEKHEALQFLTSNSFVARDSAENPNDHLVVKRYLTFTKDSLMTLRTYAYQDKVIYSEHQTQPLTLYNLGDKLFMSCNSGFQNPQPIMQVLKVTKNALTIRYFDGDEDIIRTFEKSSKPETKSASYTNCYDGHVGEYYHNTTDVTYRKGNEYLINKISKGAPMDEGDGYIIVQFNVNCQSKAGRPGLIMMDKSYQKRQFSLSLVSHILKEVMALTDWPDTVSDYKNFYYEDAHCFLMFKIENGKIVDLCP